MNHLAVVVLALVAGAFAQPQMPTWKFVGDNAFGMPFNLPSISDGNPGSCTPSTSQYAYSNVTITPNVTGPYLFESLSYYTVYVLVYMGTFDPANPCTNVIYADTYGNNIYNYDSDNNYLPETSVVFPLTSGMSYTVIVATSGSSEAAFALRVYAPYAMGNTQTSANTYNTAYGTSGCTQESSAANYSMISWTPAVSGWWDFIAVQYNSTTYTYPMNYIYLLMYNTTLTPAQLTVATGSCLSSYVWGVYASTSYQGAYMSAWVTAGQNYTFVVSGYNGDSGMWGFFQRQTPRYALYTNQWTQPQRTLPCTVGTVTSDWYGITVVAQGNRLLLTHQSDEDQEVYLYEGANTGTSTTAPGTCPAGATLIDYVDSTGAFSANSTVGVTYSLIGGPYFGGASSDDIWLDAWTGMTISGPNVFPATTGSTSSTPTSGASTSTNPTSGASTSSNPTSGASTSSNPTSTSGATSGNTDEESSPASIMAPLAALAAVALLF